MFRPAAAASTRTATARSTRPRASTRRRRALVVSNRDGLRQTVVDLMQLVREIQVGVDVDGDGTADLDASRIYYFGQSFGGIYGTSSSASSRRPRGRAERPRRLDHRDRAARPASGRSSAIAPALAHAVALQRGAERDVHELHREHAAARTADPSSTRCPARRDPGAARPRRVGAEVRQPGRAYAPVGIAAAGDRPVREGRQDGAEPDDDGDPARRRPGGPGDLLPQRPRRARRDPAVREPAHVPDQHPPGRRPPRSQAQAQIATFFATTARSRSTPTARGRSSRRRSPGRCPRDSN